MSLEVIVTPVLVLTSPLVHVLWGQPRLVGTPIVRMFVLQIQFVQQQALFQQIIVMGQHVK